MIVRSRVTGDPKMVKCHTLSRVPGLTVENFPRFKPKFGPEIAQKQRVSEKFPVSHGGPTFLSKPKSETFGHRSHPLTNILKWYSTQDLSLNSASGADVSGSCASLTSCVCLIASSLLAAVKLHCTLLVQLPLLQH
ncbi:hypothetical protein PM082_016689 [Marasmius tenuissimus]|nr:hypothetical protein PM082_016689 [Marasmius tenuissimus]